jgi:hypothetical protein
MASSPAVRSLTSISRNKVAKSAIRRDSSLLHFSQAITFPAPFPVDEFGCRVPAFSTLSTPSTVLVLNRLESSLIWKDLASRRIWYAICVWRRYDRATDAPESTRRLLGHISPQPRSVPIQARQ